jgi:Zn-dependent protease with chaperone function
MMNPGFTAEPGNKCFASARLHPGLGMTTTTAEQPALQPPVYLESLVAYFQAEDPAVWQWFAEHQAQPADLEAIRLDLLKSTYRLEKSEQPQLFEQAAKAAEVLHLTAPVSIYQSQSDSSLNASLAYIPGEIHLVLHGPVTKTLGENELLALVAHEMAHFALLDGWDGRFAICQELLRGLSVDAGAEPASLASLRLFSLHTEIFCDRGALAVCGDVNAAVNCLVKVETGVTEVNAETYLKQAAEILSKGKIRSEGVTHPETFIRARALQLWEEQGSGAEEAIRKLLHGSVALGELDLLGQQQVERLTRRLVDRLLVPDWFHTDPVLAHARLFFDEYVPPDARHKDEKLAGDLKTDDEQLQDYYCYVLLDFVSADSTLDEHPLAAAVLVTRELGLEDRFVAIAVKELKLRKKQIEDIQKQAEELVRKAR